MYKKTGQLAMRAGFLASYKADPVNRPVNTLLVFRAAAKAQASAWKAVLHLLDMHPLKC
jgi:hypothetical protein